MKEQTSFGYRLGKVLEGKRGLVLSNPEDAIDEDGSHGGGGGGGSGGGGSVGSGGGAGGGSAATAPPSTRPKVRDATERSAPCGRPGGSLGAGGGGAAAAPLPAVGDIAVLDPAGGDGAATAPRPAIGGGAGGARAGFPASPLAPAFAASSRPNPRRPASPQGPQRQFAPPSPPSFIPQRQFAAPSPGGPPSVIPQRRTTIAPLPSAPTSQAKKRFDATIGVIFKEAERAFGGSTGFACDVVDSLDDAIVELERTDVPPYSVVISVFGEDKTGNDRHWWWALAEKLRALPPDRRAPLIVANLNLTRHEARRSVCLSNGVFSFISSQGELIESLNDLFGGGKPASDGFDGKPPYAVGK